MNDCFIECPTRKADSGSGDGCAKYVQSAHRNLETFAFFTNSSRCWNTTVVEAQLRQGMWSDDIDAFVDRQSRIAWLDDERCYSLCRSCSVRTLLSGRRT